MRRAAQLWDHPKVFDDPLAVAIADGESERLADARKPFSRALRAFLVVRSRYAEDQLARAMARGVRQLVVLGAGLDRRAAGLWSTILPHKNGNALGSAMPASL